jgi:hypothetical protein
MGDGMGGFHSNDIACRRKFPEKSMAFCCRHIGMLDAPA